MTNRRVGLLVGRERSFPDALIAYVNQHGQGVEAGYVEISAVSAARPPPYDVIVDRISHDVTCYQPMLKLAALFGTKVINNPFWRIADDKFFNAALARRLSVHVPKTVLLPSKSYGQDVTAASLTNLRWVDWKAVVDELGLPLYLKPHWGGGWQNVQRVDTMDGLIAAYDRSGPLTLIAQEEIRWTQYVRCIVIGATDVLAAPWDPRLPHHQRYVGAHQSMPPLSVSLRGQVESEAKKLCQALGYQMNTVEFAVRDGVPYAIDFMNSAPDLDVASIGEGHFAWVVEKMGQLVIREAVKPSGEGLRWDQLL